MPSSSSTRSAHQRSMFTWFYFTRAFGVAMVVYGLLVDHSGDRGTIILGGLGLAGFDKVSRSEKSKD